MEAKTYKETVLAALKEACEGRKMTDLAKKIGIDYQTMIGVIRRGSGELDTLETLAVWLRENGYMERMVARETPIQYQFRDTTEMVIANDLRATADVVASTLPTEIKTDKLRTLKTHLQSYITALESIGKVKKKSVG